MVGADHVSLGRRARGISHDQNLAGKVGRRTLSCRFRSIPAAAGRVRTACLCGEYPMIPFADWFVPAILGLTFTLFGSVKLYGLQKGILGGKDKPLAQQLCGT